MRRWVFVAIGAAGLLAVVAAALAIRWSLRNPFTILIDNASDSSIAVEIDGAPVGPVSARSFRIVHTAEGQHHLIARKGAALVDEGRFTLARSPDIRASTRAVWNVGGRGRYVIQTVCYGGPKCDASVDPIGENTR